MTVRDLRKARKAARVYVNILEADFQAQVVKLALLLGWKVYHTHDSRRSHEGFPDLILIRGTRLIVAELKTRKETTTAEQRAWLGAFIDTCHGEVVLWRPDDPPHAEKWTGRIETSIGNDFGAIGQRLR